MSCEESSIAYLIILSFSQESNISQRSHVTCQSGRARLYNIKRLLRSDFPLYPASTPTIIRSACCEIPIDNCQLHYPVIDLRHRVACHKKRKFAVNVCCTNGRKVFRGVCIMCSFQGQPCESCHKKREIRN